MSYRATSRQAGGTSRTDTMGFYSFDHAPAGAYAATAKAGGCSGQFQSVTITDDTTLDFTLGDISDEFAYRCRLESHAFEEAETIIPISGEFSMNEALLSVEPAITSIVYRPPGMP